MIQLVKLLTKSLPELKVMTARVMQILIILANDWEQHQLLWLHLYTTQREKSKIIGLRMYHIYTINAYY